MTSSVSPIAFSSPSLPGENENASRRRSLHSSNRHALIELSKVPKNQNGGVLLSDDEIEAAFSFFLNDSNTGPNKDGKQNDGETASEKILRPKDVRSKFEAMTYKISKKEMKTIFDGKKKSGGITLEELKRLLLDNEIVMDPVAEAFKILDPTGSGTISKERLRKIVSNLNYGGMSSGLIHIFSENGMR